MKIESLERIRPKTLLTGGLVVFLLVILLLTMVQYVWPNSAWSVRVGKLLPFPVASIGVSTMVTTKSLGENMASIRRFYESQDFSKVGMRIDFSTDDGRKRLKMREKDLLNKMLEDRAIELLARERGIVVNPDEARQGIESKITELGTGSTVEQSLARLYGWTLSDFGEKVVLPSLYEEKLLAKFQEEDPGKAAAKAKIEKATAELKAGKTFIAVAEKFSEGRTAAEGGELGWFSRDDLAPDLQKPVEEAKRAVPTDVIESELGFHILLVDESKLEEGKRLYHLKQIFVRKPSFADWLSEKMRAMPIHVFTREYQWNMDAAEIEFREGELREFEKTLLEKAEGDPSLLL